MRGVFPVLFCSIAAGLGACGGGTTEEGGSKEKQGENAGGAAGMPGMAELGEACNSPGALSCSRSDEQLSLSCSAEGKWGVNALCEAGAICDRSSGPGFGRCTIDETCEGQLGKSFCEGGVAVTCSEQGQVIEREDCAYFCLAGVCENQECVSDLDLVRGCDSECSSLHEDCEEASERSCAHSWTASDLELGDTVLVRTPRSEDRCANLCLEGGQRFSISAWVGKTTGADAFEERPNLRLRVRTFGHWYVPSINACGTEPEKLDCGIIEPGAEPVSWFDRVERELVILSDEPDGLSGNVLVEAVDASASCSQ